jgi:hypothetical protein
MSKKELKKLHLMNNISGRKITQIEVANLLVINPYKGATIYGNMATAGDTLL